jgi:hypothetical protein
MTDYGGHPWFGAALGLVEPRRQDRVLLVCPASVHHVRAIGAQVGARGSVMVIEPGRVLAEQVAALELPQVEVLALQPGGDERFGTFDVMVCCPLGLPPWPLSRWGELARSNLRPGGRLVVDLPGAEMSPDLAACIEEIGGDPRALEPFHGPSEEDLAQSLRQAGMRRVTAALGVHLLQLLSPHDLAEMLGEPLQLDEVHRAELGRALARRLKTASSVEVLIHRTRVAGMR